MNKISVIGLDLAKNVFQVHGIDLDGEVVVPRQASSGGKARLLGISKRGDGYVCFH
jgi:transposase